MRPAAPVSPIHIDIRIVFILQKTIGAISGMDLVLCTRGKTAVLLSRRIVILFFNC